MLTTASGQEKASIDPAVNPWPIVQPPAKIPPTPINKAPLSQMFVTGCEAPPIVQLIVLLIVPGVYLALMYLTLTSQDWRSLVVRTFRID